MNIHEYQGRDLFQQFNIPTPPGEVARNLEEAKAAAEKLEGKKIVVKAQVQVGGRGKAGGVKLASSTEEAAKLATEILGLDIKGHITKKVLVAEAVDIAKEYYCALVLDRDSGMIMLMVSEDGGVDIEEVAEKNPEKILKAWIDPEIGFRPFHAWSLFSEFLTEKTKVNQAVKVVQGMYNLFIAKDCTQVEINPLVETPDGTIIAADAKLNFDDNALYRQKELADEQDPEYVDKVAEDAATMGLSFIPMDGYVGCVVNGAGLAMATMDVVKLFGGDPANFLDVGGSSNPDKVVKAIEIITANPKVKSILFNIFGGITRCDDIARGLLTALERIDVKLPIIVRLTGTNEKEAHEMLKTNPKLQIESTMNDAVKAAVDAANAA